jgi:uncharacterized protein YbgA (DUF1722 family)
LTIGRSTPNKGTAFKGSLQTSESTPNLNTINMTQTQHSTQSHTFENQKRIFVKDDNWDLNPQQEIELIDTKIANCADMTSRAILMAVREEKIKNLKGINAYILGNNKNFGIQKNKLSRCNSARHIKEVKDKRNMLLEVKTQRLRAEQTKKMDDFKNLINKKKLGQSKKIMTILVLESLMQKFRYMHVKYREYLKNKADKKEAAPNIEKKYREYMYNEDPKKEIE